MCHTLKIFVCVLKTMRTLSFILLSVGDEFVMTWKTGIKDSLSLELLLLGSSFSSLKAANRISMWKVILLTFKCHTNCVDVDFLFHSIRAFSAYNLHLKWNHLKIAQCVMQINLYCIINRLIDAHPKLHFYPVLVQIHLFKWEA